MGNAGCPRLPIAPEWFDGVDEQPDGGGEVEEQARDEQVGVGKPRTKDKAKGTESHEPEDRIDGFRGGIRPFCPHRIHLD